MSIQLSNGGCGVLGQRQAPSPRILIEWIVREEARPAARAYFSAHFIGTFLASPTLAATR
jgi:hypothetical protein